LLFTFVIFGSSLIWTWFGGLNLRTVLFAAFAVLIRVPVYLISLIGSNVDRRSRMVIAWYGPSGLSSLLLVLLPVFAGVPGSDVLFRISALIVLISIVLHGASPPLLARYCKVKHKEPTVPEPTELRPLPVVETPVSESTQPVGTQSISLEELAQLQKAGEPVIILDVRTERSRETSDYQAQGSVRVVPENVVAQANKLNLRKDAWLIAYCA
jgi:NhaP-type Na+/H+ or K+/H+ antiporter